MVKEKIDKNGKRFIGTFIDKDDNIKHCSYSENIHGIYAKTLAESFSRDGIRINNYYEIEDSNVKLYWFDRKNKEEFTILIDKENFDLIKDYHWYCVKSINTYYAKATVPKDKKELIGNSINNIFMHRLIGDVINKPEVIPNHINGNGLDNRLKNLEFDNRRNNNAKQVNLSKNNSSGLKGVSLWKIDEKTGIPKAYVAQFTDSNGKRIRRQFLLSKYGNDEAKKLALSARKLMEEIDNNEKFDEKWNKMNR